MSPVYVPLPVVVVTEVVEGPVAVVVALGLCGRRAAQSASTI